MERYYHDAEMDSASWKKSSHTYPQTCIGASVAVVEVHGEGKSLWARGHLEPYGQWVLMEDEEIQLAYLEQAYFNSRVRLML